MGAHSRSGNADRPVVTNVPDHALEPLAGRSATGAAWQAHAAALNLQGSVTRIAQEQALAGRRQSRRWAWLFAVGCLLAAVVIVTGYGWRLGG